VLLRFLKLLFELSHLFGQMAYLIGIPTAWFLPGLLRGIEGLSQPVLLAAVLVEPTALGGVVSRERSVNSLAPFAKLVGTALLGVPFVGSSPMRTLPFSGYVVTCRFGGCSYLGLIGSGCFIRPFGKHFLKNLEVQKYGPRRSETRELSCESGCTDSSMQLVGGSV
jgi:hypothetical protein